MVGPAKGSAPDTPAPVSADLELASITSMIRCCFDRLNTANTHP